MESYYSRPWRGAVQVRSAESPYGDWIDGTGFIFVSVEHALGGIAKSEVTGLEWRIVDRGGNVYETGHFPGWGHGVIGDGTRREMDATGTYLHFKRMEIA